MYAKINKYTNLVESVGGSEIGLPIVENDEFKSEDIQGNSLGIKIGYAFADGQFYDPGNVDASLRRNAYISLTHKEDGSALIPWEGSAITVDQANKVYLEYSAENSIKAAEIQALIVPAKAYIRNLFPDA